MSPVSRSRTKKSKSKPAKAKGARRNGSPATRAEQTAEAHMADLRRLIGAETTDWWDDSVENVLSSCEELRDSGSALVAENTVVAVLGTELAKRLATEHDGFDLPSWLVRVANAAADRVAAPAADPATALLLLYAIASFGTTRAAQAAAGHLRRLRPTLSQNTIDTYPWLNARTHGAAPTAAPLTIRNGYGDRWAVLAPFAIDGMPDTAHWYRWDIDACGIQRTVAAGVFETAEAAVAEWRNAIGPTATTATPETTHDPALLSELLAELIRAGVFDGYLVGDEPADLLAEYFRSRKRAMALLKSVDPGGRRSWKATRDRPTPEQVTDVADRFADWCRQQSRGPVPDQDSVYSLVDQWISPNPAAWRYACSPHRIRATALALTNEFIDEYAREMLALLPHWVAWCAEQTTLDARLTELATDAANLVSTPEAVRAVDPPEATAVRIIE